MEYCSLALSDRHYCWCCHWPGDGEFNLKPNIGWKVFNAKLKMGLAFHTCGLAMQPLTTAYFAWFIATPKFVRPILVITGPYTLKCCNVSLFLWNKCTFSGLLHSGYMINLHRVPMIHLPLSFNTFFKCTFLMKLFKFWIQFDRSLFFGVQLIMIQHWFGK